MNQIKLIAFDKSEEWIGMQRGNYWGGYKPHPTIHHKTHYDHFEIIIGFPLLSFGLALLLCDMLTII